METNLKNLLLLLQINDTQFPIGSYSHSYGFETYIQDRTVADEEDAMEYLTNYMEGSFLYTDLLSAYLAYDYSKNHSIKDLIQLNKILRAIKSQKELREASEKLGSRLIKTILEMDINSNISYLKEVVLEHEKLDLPIHHSVAYGIISYLSNVDLDSALVCFSFNVMAGMVSNSVKTIPISQMSGQRILLKSQDLAVELVKKVKEIDVEYLGISFPGVEISSMRHENLYSRLYMS